jgi:hypothetical protein
VERILGRRALRWAPPVAVDPSPVRAPRSQPFDPVYYKSVRPDAEDLELMRRIDEMHLEFPFYGSRRVSGELRARGLVANRKWVQRLMRLMGVGGIAPRPNTSRPAPQHPVYPYLLRGLSICKRPA